MCRPLLVTVIGGILAAGCGGAESLTPGPDPEVPGTGTLRITTATTGSPLDPDGYRVSIDSGEARPLGTQATLVVDAVTPGAHRVMLSDVSPECTVAGENPRILNVTAGSSTETTFSISCTPVTEPPARLLITSATIGSAPDADGYIVNVSGLLEQPVGPNELVTLEVPGGQQTLLLSGLAPGCTVDGENPRIITLIPGLLTGTTFFISCPGSAAGQIAFTTNRDGNDEIYVVNADGTGLRRLTTHPAADFQPSWAPDGSRLAFSSTRNGGTSIYVMDANGENVIDLSHGNEDFLPAWSPDGSKIAFVRNTGNIQTAWEIFIMDPDGSNQVNLTNNQDIAAAPAWSPDGTRLLFESDRNFDFNPEELAFEIFVMNADGTGIVNLTNNNADDEFPSWSPDGRRIAFQTDRVGDSEIFLMDPSGANLVNLTNNPAKDFQPVWSPEGSRIAFTSSRYSASGQADLLVMAPDGAGVIRLTAAEDFVRTPDWRP